MEMHIGNTILFNEWPPELALIHRTPARSQAKGKQ